MASATDSLWWTSHGGVHALLQNSSTGLCNVVQKQLDGHFDWLLHSLQNFKQQSAASAKLLDSKSITLRGKKFNIEGKLKQATIKSSVLLDLDEIQAHILLKRWLKDTGQEGLLQDPTSDGQEIQFGQDVLLQVMAYYHQERLLLIKCLQYILLQSMADRPLLMFSESAARLLKADLDDFVFASLRTNFEAGLQQGVGGAAGGAGAAAAGGAGSGVAHAAAAAAAMAQGAGTIAGRMAAVMKEFGAQGNTVWISEVHTAMREQLLQERCELLATLLLIYEMPSSALPAEKDASRAAPRCSNHRLLELVRMLGSSLFPAVPADELEEDGSGVGGWSMSEARTQSESGDSLAVSEYLASLLVLSALDLTEYIALTAVASTAPVSTPDALPLGGKMRDVHNELRSWAGTVTNAGLLLTWSAVVKLMDSYIDLGEASTEALMARAFQAGGFGAIASCLKYQGTLISSAFGTVCRGVVLKALCVVGTAYEIGMNRLDSTTYEQLLDLLQQLLSGDSSTCASLWGLGPQPDKQHLESVRLLLKDACAVFPAVSGPYVQLLSIFSEGPLAANAAYAHLQAAPRLVSLHRSDDTALQPLNGWPAAAPIAASRGILVAGATVVLPAAIHWTQAPSVQTLVLPPGVEGVVLPMPATLSHLSAAGMVLVEWDVDVGGKGHAGQSNFGQFLMLGRAVHCLHELANSMHMHLVPEPVFLQDLKDCLSLMLRFVQQLPHIVPELMQLSVEMAGSGVKRDWMDVAAAAAAILPQLPMSAMTASDAAIPLQLLSHLSLHHPHRVLASLHHLPLLYSAAAPQEQRIPTLPLVSVLEDRQFPDPGLCLGLLPTLRLFQQTVEGKQGRYPTTRAFLELLCSFLSRGYVSGPLSTYVLYCLHELLPSCHSWQYASADERWLLAALAFKVVRLSIEAGSHVVESAGANEPTSDVSSISAQAAATSTPFVPATPSVHVTGLGCHVLRQLLLHTSSILARSLPPPIHAMESLRQSDPSSAGVAAVEKAVAELLRLLPLAVCASEPCGHDLPLEDFLFNSAATACNMPPAELLAAYLTYQQPEYEQQEQDSLTYLALKAIQSMQALLSRPVSRSMQLLTMSRLVPRGSPTEAALKELFRPDVARSSPKHFLLAVEILETAAEQDHAELLDGLAFPSGLQPVAVEPPPNVNPATTAPTPVGALPAPATSTTTPLPSTTAGSSAAGDAKAKAGSKKRASQPDAWSVLDGLFALLHLAPELKEDQPEVLCHTLHAICALWQNQSVACFPVNLFRSKGPEFWGLLEECLHNEGGAGGQAGSSTTPAPEDKPECGEPWGQLSEAFVWQILMLEAFVCPRATAGNNGSPDSGMWALVDRLSQSGMMQDTILRCSRLPLSRHAVRQLLLLTQATYLELGAVGLSGIFSGCGGTTVPENLVAAAVDMKQEMEELSQLLLVNSATTNDLEVAHTRLLRMARAAKAAGIREMGDAGLSTPTAAARAAHMEEGEDDEETDYEEFMQGVGVDLFGAGSAATRLAHGDVGSRIVALLSSRPLGRTLLSHSQPLVGLTMESVTYGPSYLFDGGRVMRLLGPAATSQIGQASGLSSSMAVISASASLASARLTTLQAVCGLAAVLPKNSAFSEPERLCTAAVQSATCCVSDLVAFGAQSELVWQALQQPWGLGSLPQHLVEAALVSTKFVLHSLTMLKTQKGGGGDKPPSTAPKASPGPSGIFSTPAAAPKAAPKGTTQAGAAAATPAAVAAATVTCCLSLVTLLSSWLRAVSKGCVGVGLRCDPAVLVTITDYLASSTMVVLQLSHSSAQAAGGMPAGGAAGNQRSVQAVLLDALPQLCKMCRRGAVSLSVGTQLLVEVVQRHLPPSEWLPIVRDHVDIMAMLSEAAGHMSATLHAATLGPSRDQDLYIAGDLGVLQLALAVSQVPEGAHMLHDQGVLHHLAALGRRMCAAEGGALAPFSSLELSITGGGNTTAFRPSISAPGQDSASVDVSAAYIGGAWSPVHKQWTVMLSFTSVMLRMLGQHIDVETEAVDFIVCCEPRLLLSLLPPAGNASQPLTLAGLLEAERTLFLLTHCAQRFSGTWQLMLPSSLQRFRTAASSLITFIAQPSNNKHEPASLDCPPQSTEERRMSGANSGVLKSEGWFQICARGSEVTSSSSDVAAQQPLLLTNGGGTSSASWPSTMCSDYAARVAESVYACLHHALTFLLATSPQISEWEAATLGPMWPKVRDLVVLQEQCKVVLASMSAEYQPSGAGAAGREGDRHRRISQLLLKVMTLLSQFLEALGYTAPPVTASMAGGRRSTASGGGSLHFGSSSSYRERDYSMSMSMENSHGRRDNVHPPPLFSLTPLAGAMSTPRSMSTSLAT